MEGEGRRKENTQVQRASYPLGGKIMMSTVVVVFSVVVLILCLHIYARCCVLRQRRRDSDRSIRRRRSRLVFAGESGNGSAEFASPVGMDAAALRSLPVFVFSAKGEEEEVECAVCLSELGDGEVGRLLPECKHGFHVDCIDMWLLCHSTCPLCRVAVHPPAVTGVDAESVELRSGMDGEDQQSSSSSFRSSASSSTSPAWLGLKPPAGARAWLLKVMVGRDGSSPPTSRPGEVDLEGGGGGRDHGLRHV